MADTLDEVIQNEGESFADYLARVGNAGKSQQILKASNPTNDGIMNTGSFSDATPLVTQASMASNTQDAPPQTDVPNSSDLFTKYMAGMGSSGTDLGADSSSSISTPALMQYAASRATPAQLNSLINSQGLDDSQYGNDNSSQAPTSTQLQTLLQSKGLDTPDSQNPSTSSSASDAQFFKGLQASNTDPTSSSTDVTPQQNLLQQYASANNIGNQFIPSQPSNSDQSSDQSSDTNTQVPFVPPKTQYTPYVQTDASPIQSLLAKLQTLQSSNPQDDPQLAQALQDRSSAIKKAGIVSGIQQILSGALQMQARQKVDKLPDVSPDLFGAQNYQNVLDMKKGQLLNQQMLTQQIANVQGQAKAQDELRDIANLDAPLDDFTKAMLKAEIGRMQSIGDSAKNQAYDLIDSGDMTLRKITKNPLLSNAFNTGNSTWVKSQIQDDNGNFRQVMVNNKTLQTVDIGQGWVAPQMKKDANNQTVMFDRSKNVTGSPTPYGQQKTLQNPNVLDFIQKQEGFDPMPKLDSDGNPVVGFGTKITSEQAAAIKAQGGIDRQGAIALQKDAYQKNVAPYLQKINVDLNANQMTALGSAFYNLAPDSRQAIVDKINSGASSQDVAFYLQQFNKARQPDNTKVPMQALTDRRVREGALYITPSVVYPLGKAGDPVVDPQTGQPLSVVTNNDYDKLNPSQQKALDDSQKKFEKDGMKPFLTSLNAGNQASAHLQSYIDDVNAGRQPNAMALQSAKAWIPRMDGLQGKITDAQYDAFGGGNSSLMNQVNRLIQQQKTGAKITTQDIGDMTDLIKDYRNVQQLNIANVGKMYMGPLQQKIPGASLDLLAPNVDWDANGAPKASSNLGQFAIPSYNRATNTLSPSNQNNGPTQASNTGRVNAKPAQSLNDLP